MRCEKVLVRFSFFSYLSFIIPNLHASYIIYYVRVLIIFGNGYKNVITKANDNHYQLKVFLRDSI